MIQWLNNFFGTYTPVTYQVWDETNQYMQTIIPSGAAGVDWQFVANVFIFGIVLYCFFRTLGGILCRS